MNKVRFQREGFTVDPVFARGVEMVLAQSKDLIVQTEFIFVAGGHLKGMAVVHQLFGGGMEIQLQRRQRGIKGVTDIDGRLEFPGLAGGKLVAQFSPVFRTGLAFIRPVRGCSCKDGGGQGEQGCGQNAFHDGSPGIINAR